MTIFQLLFFFSQGKLNVKLRKQNIPLPHRVVSNFNEKSFTSDLSNELSALSLSQSDVNDNVATWYAIINRNLDRLPDWITQEIMEARRMRDNSKCDNNWADYKRYRNKTKNLIRKAKRKYFSESAKNLKDAKAICQYLRTVNKYNISTSSFAIELSIDNEKITDPRDIANKLNDYFTSVCKRLNEGNNVTPTSDLTKLINVISNKIPENIYFKIPPITTQQVSYFI